MKSEGKAENSTGRQRQRDAVYRNGIEKRGGDLTCKGSELNSDGTAEHGCAEAKLSEARRGNGIDLICEEKLRKSTVWTGTVMEQISVERNR